MVSCRPIISHQYVRPTSNMIYYALTMRADLNGGSIYISFALSSLMALPGVAISFFLINICGRKLLQSVSFTICGILLLLNWILSSYSIFTIVNFNFGVFSFEYYSSFLSFNIKNSHRLLQCWCLYSSTRNDANSNKKHLHRLWWCHG